jgi:hypothetical protein
VIEENILLEEGDDPEFFRYHQEPVKEERKNIVAEEDPIMSIS